ncbi:MAG: penicillin-binding protein [Bryobacter sp.]|nr:penicillin-binding protein [Bryobacter sp.]
MLYPPIDPAAERRARLLLRILAVWGLLIFGRLLHLQVVQHDKYQHAAEAQQVHRVEIAAHRGTVEDRNGHVLAITIPTERVVVNPAKIEDVGLAAELLANMLHLDSGELTAKIAARAKAPRGRQYLVVAENATSADTKRLRDLRLKWVAFQDSSKRVYPNEQLAAHILGGITTEGHGSGGIEQSLEDELGGYAGYANIVSDVANRGFDTQMEAEPVPGNDVTLTIDHRIQYDLERYLEEAVKGKDCATCKTARGIVMDPVTGDILAMANYPTYNPNERFKKTEVEARRNLAVQSAIEPGSVFKVFTISGAIEEKVVTPQRSYFCGNGRYNLFGRIIHDAHPYGYLTVEDTLAKSSNICSIQIAQDLTEKRFFDYILRFGFGSRTGIPLPGESSGRVIRLKNWTKSSIGSVAMGHEVMATTVQLAQAMSVVANGGRLVKPRLVLQVKPNHLSPYRIRKASYDWPVAEGQQVLSPESVVTMRNMLDRVVQVGTGKSAKIPGYSSGGKTGSAQMFDPVTNRYLHRYHASFMGFAPVNNPRVVVVVTLDGADKYGGVVAAPVFSKVAGSALRVLNVPPDLPMVEDQGPAAPVIFNDVSFAELTEQRPVEATETVDPAPVSFAKEVRSTMVTPDFLGKPLRDVLSEAARQGFRIQPLGSGVVRAQEPAPGSPIAYGQRIEIKLGR